jgi:DVNP family
MVKKTLRNMSDGLYHHHGKTYKVWNGSRAQVMHGTAYQTKAGLTMHDFKKNKHGKIVSKKKSVTAKREKRLWKLGYRFKKGKFGVVKVSGVV